MFGQIGKIMGKVCVGDGFVFLGVIIVLKGDQICGMNLDGDGNYLFELVLGRYSLIFCVIDMQIDFIDVVIIVD